MSKDYKLQKDNKVKSTKGLKAAVMAIVALVATSIGLVGCSDIKTAQPAATQTPKENTLSIDIDQNMKDYRIDPVSKVYTFLEAANGDDAAIIDGKKLMFTWDEAMAFNIYQNAADADKLLTLFGSYNKGMTYDKIKDDYNTFMLKLMIYEAMSKKEAPIDNLFCDDKNRVAFDKFDKIMVEYKNADEKTRVGIAKNLIKAFEDQFINGVKAPDESLNPSTATAIAMIAQAFNTMAARSEAEFSDDSMKLIVDAQMSACGEANDAVKMAIQTIQTAQLIDGNIGNKNELSEYSYEKLMNDEIAKLKAANEYPDGSEFNIASYNPEKYDLGNGKQSELMSDILGKTTIVTGESGKKVIKQGSVAAGDYNNFRNSLSSDSEKKQADDGKKAVDDNIKKTNDDEAAQGKGYTDGYNATYKTVFAAVEASGVKTSPIASKAVPAGVNYDNGYATGWNVGINDGIANGYDAYVAEKAARDAMNQITPATTPQATATPTPSASASTEATVQATATPSATASTVKALNDYKAQIMALAIANGQIKTSMMQVEKPKTYSYKNI